MFSVLTLGSTSTAVAPEQAIDQRQVDLFIEGHVLTLAYTVAGSGPPLVLIHGLGDSAFTWYRVLPILAQTHTVYALDLPGFGASSRPNAPYTPDFLTATVVGFLDALRLPSVGLVGNSLGGLIALRLADTAPQRVASLALIDSAGLGRSVAPTLRLLTIPGIGDLVQRWNRTPPGAWQWALGLTLQLFAAPWRAPWPWIAHIYHMARSPGYLRATVATARAELSLLGQRREALMRNRLPQLTMPALIVWGAHDRVLPLRHGSNAHAQLPHSTLVVISGGGHLPHLEQPLETGMALGRFFTAQQHADMEEFAAFPHHRTGRRE